MILKNHSLIYTLRSMDGVKVEDLKADDQTEIEHDEESVESTTQ